MATKEEQGTDLCVFTFTFKLESVSRVPSVFLNHTLTVTLI